MKVVYHPWENRLPPHDDDSNRFFGVLTTGYEKFPAFFQYLSVRKSHLQKSLKPKPVDGKEESLRQWQAETEDTLSRISQLNEVLNIPIYAMKQLKLIEKREEDKDRRARPVPVPPS